MPEISIVIPVYNEEKYVSSYIGRLSAELTDARVDDYEIVLVENGSTDNTRRIALDMGEKNSRLRVITLEKADYGAALKAGLLAAKGSYILQFDLDYWDISFLRKTVLLFREFEYNIIIGSKNMLMSKDKRRPIRRIISQGFRFFLWTFFDLRVSDTHGIKAWKNDESLRQVIRETKFGRHIFDTELVLRSQKADLSIIELPMTVVEQRPSSSKALIKRIPEAVTDLIYLWWELNFARKDK
ncbi:MAG: glycosyltransferase [Nitrospirae bacterium]|nr:glycosyltransferase [Nitrospirota bacterium]